MSSFKDLASDYYWCTFDVIDKEALNNLIRSDPGFDVDELLRHIRRVANKFDSESRNNRELWEKVFCAAYDDNCAMNCEDTMNEKHDNVNHPSHYTKGGIECIDAIKASMSLYEFRGYLKGNAIKYLWRYRLKGHAKEDLKKAQWYLNKLVEDLN